MRFKKVSTVILSALMVSGCFAGCSSKENKNVTENSKGGEVTISLFDKNSGSSTFEDPVAQKIMEETGIKIQVENPTGDPAEKLNLMLTGKNYPDIVLMERGGDLLNRYIEAGALVDLTDLIEEQGPNIKEMYGDTLKKIRYKDGRNYYLSNWYGADPDSAAGVLMRYDILCELVGKERADSNEPFTQDEFINICKQFKEKYPTINGKDSIAITLNGGDSNYNGTIMGMYGMKSYAETENGLEHIAKDENYTNMISFMNTLYTDGLLDKEWIVNKTEQFTQKLSTGNVFATFASYWDTDLANTSLKSTIGENAIFKSYKVLGKDISKDETTYTGRSTLGWDAIAITNNCKNIEAAMKLIDFLVSEEGQYLMMWGIEGETWNMVDGKHVPTEEILEDINNDFESMKLETGVRKWTWFIKNGYGEDGTPYDLAYKYNLTETADFANNSFGESDRWDLAYYDGLTPAGSTPEGLKWQKIQDIYNQTFPKMVNASSNEEAINIYNKMISEMENAGLGEVEKVITENYNERMKLWGETE